MKMLWLAGEVTVEAPCRRHASACQGEATKTEASPESPFGRGLSGATAALSRLARVSAIPCARRLALTPDRLPQSDFIINQRVLNLIAVRGLQEAMGYPTDPEPMAAWAQRLKAAHYNAVENLVLFAPLILVVETTALNNSATAMSAAVYFFARLLHAVCYAAAVPYLRTVAFAVSWLSVLCIVWQILSA